MKLSIRVWRRGAGIAGVLCAALIAVAVIGGALPLGISGQASGTCGSGPGGNGPVGAKCGNKGASIDVQPFDKLSTDPAHPTTVTVTGTGFGANEVFGAELCRAVVTSNNDCDSNTAITGHTSAQGGFTLSFAAGLEPDGTIHTPNGNVACDESGNCSVGASNFAETGGSANQHAANEDVGFNRTTKCGSGPGGNGPVGAKCGNKGASIDVQPFDKLSTDPAHPTTVTVTGTGFGANEVFGAELCRAVVTSNNDCDSNTAITGHTSAQGGFTLSFAAGLEPDGTIHTPNGNVACDESGNCSVGASNFAETGGSANQHAANEDVGFNRSGSTPTPTPTPSTPTTTPTPSGSGSASCGSGPGGNGPVGAKCGNLGASIDVQPYDHLSTNPSSPTTVAVTGSGFGPSEVVGAELCLAVVRSNNDCDSNTAVTGKTDSSGRFTLDLAAALESDGTIHTPNGNVACNDTGNCSVGSSNFAEPGPGASQHAANEDVGFGGAGPVAKSVQTPTPGGNSASNGGGGTQASLTGTSASAAAASASAAPSSAAAAGSPENDTVRPVATTASESVSLPWPLLGTFGFIVLLVSFAAGALARLRMLP